MTSTELAELLAAAQAELARLGPNATREEYQDAVARAFLAAPPPLAWSDEKPTVPGLYLWRYDSISPVDDWEIVEAAHDEKFGMTRRRGKWPHSFPHGEYFGPIPLPVGLDASCFRRCPLPA